MAFLMLARPSVAEPSSPAQLGSFTDVKPRDVLIAAFGTWDATTKRVPGSDEMAEVDELRAWKYRGQETLLAVVGRWTGDPESRWVTASNGEFSCDVLMLARVAGELRVIAKADRVVTCGAATNARLDLAAYDMDSSTRLIGVRSRTMNKGYEEEDLTLLKANGSVLTPVFTRNMHSEDGNAGTVTSSAVLQVEKAAAGPNVFVIVEDRLGKKTRERWKVANNGKYERYLGAPILNAPLLISDGQAVAWVLQKGRYHVKISVKASDDSSYGVVAKWVGANCADMPEAQELEFECVLDKSASLTVENPSALGLGPAARGLITAYWSVN